MAPLYRNWARTVRFRPQEAHHPADEGEVAALVRRARDEGRQLRVGGALHSWSALAATTGMYLELDRMASGIAVSRELGLVTCDAGTRLWQLNEALAEAGHALPILGSIAEQTVAGAIATGTHGSSMAYGNLASLVAGMRFVDGRGVVVEWAGEEPDLAGGRVSLGALGVVTEVTLRCERAFRLVEELEHMPFDRVCADLPEIARSAEYVKLWWLPHTSTVLVFRYHRAGVARERTALARAIDTRVVNGAVFDALLRFGAALPFLVPLINRIVVPVAFPAARAAGPSARMLTIAMPPRHFESEAAVALADGGAALERVRATIARGRHKVNFVQELRFGPADDAWMSPAAERDTCYVGTYRAGVTAAHRGPSDRYFADVAAALADLDPRPHWGKALPEPDGLWRRYPNGDDFRAMVATHDPDGVFRSPLLARILA